MDEILENYSNIKKCRICGSTELTPVIELKPQFLSPTFVKSNENNKLSKIKIPLTVLLCEKKLGGCGLVQLKETVKADILYADYFYRSGLNDVVRADLKRVVEKVQEKVTLKEGDAIVDIGANDCTMIDFFPKNTMRIDVEPAKNIDWKNVDPSIKIVNDYFSKSAVKSVLNDKKVKIFTSCAMFYDLNDPNSFVSDVKSLLAKDGVWGIQLSYVSEMIKNLNFYDICHEHLEYYSLQTLSTLMERHGLKIIDAEINKVNGGSLLVFIAHEESSMSQSENMKEILRAENEMDLYNSETYKKFYQKMEELSGKVRGYVESEIEKGNKVIGLGASTKGNVLLQFFGIDKNMLPGISERNPMKVGLYTMGSDIEPVSEEHTRELNPSCMLVLPWYFKKEIVEREQEYINNGGKLLFPMPYPHLITKKED